MVKLMNTSSTNISQIIVWRTNNTIVINYNYHIIYQLVYSHLTRSVIKVKDNDVYISSANIFINFHMWQPGTHYYPTETTIGSCVWNICILPWQNFVWLNTCVSNDLFFLETCSKCISHLARHFPCNSKHTKFLGMPVAH